MPNLKRLPYMLILVSLAVVLSALFGIGVLWYQGPASLLLRLMIVAGWIGLASGTLLLYACRERAAFLAGYAVPFALLMFWFGAISPGNDRVWSPEMDRTVTYTTNGDTIVVSNVRNFRWTGPETAEPNWETRTYDLNALANVDVLSLYWKGPRIAHTYFSFVWNSGEALSISIEIRKEKDEAYSPIGGFFKAYELAVLAGDERDFYGWRVFFPDEDIQLFRTRANPAQARALLIALLDSANRVAKTPVFYNTLLENCTTEVWMLTDAMGKGTPSDWRILASGYLPDFLHDEGILDTSLSLETLRARGHVLPAAKVALDQGLSGPAFSSAIRGSALGASPSPEVMPR
jgi:hypothetical protein